MAHNYIIWLIPEVIYDSLQGDLKYTNKKQ